MLEEDSSKAFLDFSKSRKEGWKYIQKISSTFAVLYCFLYDASPVSHICPFAQSKGCVS